MHISRLIVAATLLVSLCAGATLASTTTFDLHYHAKPMPDNTCDNSNSMAPDPNVTVIYYYPYNYNGYYPAAPQMMPAPTIMPAPIIAPPILAQPVPPPPMLLQYTPNGIIARPDPHFPPPFTPPYPSYQTNGSVIIPQGYYGYGYPY